jgi:hypothetical protein
MRSTNRRPVVGTLFAAGAGLAIAVVDSRPGFDAVGLTVVALIAAAAIAVVLAGARRLTPAAFLGLIVGIWVPLLELPGSAGPASLAAVAFAIAGALGAAAALRLQSGEVSVH